MHINTFCLSRHKTDMFPWDTDIYSIKVIYYNSPEYCNLISKFEELYHTQDFINLDSQDQRIKRFNNFEI